MRPSNFQKCSLVFAFKIPNRAFWPFSKWKKNKDSRFRHGSTMISTSNFRIQTSPLHDSNPSYAEKSWGKIWNLTLTRERFEACKKGVWINSFWISESKNSEAFLGFRKLRGKHGEWKKKLYVFFYFYLHGCVIVNLKKGRCEWQVCWVEDEKKR